MIRNLALAGLLAMSTLGAPAAATAGPGCSVCYWDWQGMVIGWVWECPGVDAQLCDAPPPPPD
jgi:hypothetical protein